MSGLNAGEVASYIPELTKADPAWLGIALVTVDGHVYQVGDSRQPFTIQSISKLLLYGLALEMHGRERVLERVGVAPTADRFNSIALDDDGIVTAVPGNHVGDDSSGDVATKCNR